MDQEHLEEIGGKLRAWRLPRWEELPDFGLYMDQVLMLLGQYMEDSGRPGEKTLTSSMINNYVKMGALPAPNKKKYDRVHLALLIVICVLKPVLPIAAIRDLSTGALSAEKGSELYNDFCALFEETNAAVAACALPAERGFTPRRAMVQSALRARAEQSISQEILMQMQSE